MYWKGYTCKGNGRDSFEILSLHFLGSSEDKNKSSLVVIVGVDSEIRTEYCRIRVYRKPYLYFSN
jgi:hypothetical protein